MDCSVQAALARRAKMEPQRFCKPKTKKDKMKMDIDYILDKDLMKKEEVMQVPSTLLNVAAL